MNITANLFLNAVIYTFSLVHNHSILHESAHLNQQIWYFFWFRPHFHTASNVYKSEQKKNIQIYSTWPKQKRRLKMTNQIKTFQKLKRSNNNNNNTRKKSEITSWMNTRQIERLKIVERIVFHCSPFAQHHFK